MKLEILGWNLEFLSQHWSGGRGVNLVFKSVARQSSYGSVERQEQVTRLVARILGIALSLAMVTPVRADYTIVLERSFIDDKLYRRAQAITRTEDAAYVVAGRDPLGAFALRAGVNFQRDWERHFRGPGEPREANTVMPSRDGGVLVAGHTSARGDSGAATNVAFVAKLDKFGQTVWQKEFGNFDKTTGNGRFVCGTQLAQGYILVGTRYKLWTNQPTRSGVALINALWVAKIDENGNLLWERIIAEDGEDLVDGTHLQQNVCGIPIEDAAGNITFAVSFQAKSSILQDGARIVAGPDIPHSAKRVVLLLQYDKDGKEVKRVRVANGTTPRLFSRAQGYFLLDNLLDRDRRGLRQTFLDRDLRIASERVTVDLGFYIYMESALPDGQGGVHLAGYKTVPPNSRGRTALAHMDSKGELSSITTIGSGLPTWEPIGLALGASPGELVLLHRGAGGGAVSLVKLRYLH